MFKKNEMFKKLVLVAAFGILGSPIHVASAQTIELTAGHAASTAYFYQDALEKMADVMAERSGGALKLNIFADGQLGGEVKLVQSVRTGTIDITVTATPVYEGFVPEFSVFSFPFVFDSGEQADRILSGPVGEEFLSLLPDHGLVSLGFLSSIERNIYTRGQVIQTADDVRGLKIRVMQSPGYVKAYEALSARPTPMASAELYLGLQNGTLDAGETAPDLFLQSRFNEVAKVYSLTKINYMPTIMAISKQKLEALSPEHQEILTDAAKIGIDFAIAKYRKDYDESLATIRSSGETQLVEADVESFRAMVPTVHADLLKEFPSAGAWLDKISSAKLAE